MRVEARCNSVGRVGLPGKCRVTVTFIGEGELLKVKSRFCLEKLSVLLSARVQFFGGVEW